MASIPQAVPLARSRSVAQMSVAEKLGEALSRSLPHLSPEARVQVEAMLSPEALGVLAGILTAWLASHAFGVGEIVDLILVVGGGIALGWSVFQLAQELYDFAATAINATSEAQLDAAGDHFARAVAIGGITLVLSLLTRGAGRSLRRGVPKTSGPPPAGGRVFSRAPIIRDPALPAGAGETSPYGVVRVSPHGPLSEQQLVEFHERVHRALSPRFRLFQELRADLSMHGYNRSALLRYLEEALAETYAQLRVNGFRGTLDGIRFPLRSSHYQITLTRLAMEGTGVLMGTIVVGGAGYTVYLLTGGGRR